MAAKMTTVFQPSEVREANSTGYPEPWATEAAKRHNRRLGDHAGLTNFGVVMTRLEPGGRSSQRHAHQTQDEFVMVLEGEVILHTDAGEQALKPGACVGFPAGTGDAHCFLNRSAADAVILVVGDRTPGDVVAYPDIDLRAEERGGRFVFLHRDGLPYTEERKS
jgi:uncharacterized cupin superfamily protein